MCGIIGIVSRESKSIPTLLHNGLKKLEYRGYDSFGIACKTNTSLEIQRFVGAPSDINISFEGDNYSLGIAHTRWATHGGVKETNAHPHTIGDITLVHNGIIENYEEIKTQLQEHYTYSSETDTEVVAAYLDYHKKLLGNTLEALQQLYKDIKGSFAMVVIDNSEATPRLYFASYLSPLIIGKGVHTHYIASDSIAFLEHTQVINYIESGHIGYIESDNVYVYKASDGSPDIRRDIVLERDSLIEDNKNGYPYHMLKEILLDTKNVVHNVLLQKEGVLEAVCNAIETAENTIIIGCGTSKHMADAGFVFLKKYASPHITKRIQVYNASEIDVFERLIDSNTVIIALYRVLYIYIIPIFYAIHPLL